MPDMLKWHRVCGAGGDRILYADERVVFDGQTVILFTDSQPTFAVTDVAYFNIERDEDI